MNGCEGVDTARFAGLVTPCRGRRTLGRVLRPPDADRRPLTCGSLLSRMPVALAHCDGGPALRSKLGLPPEHIDVVRAALATLDPVPRPLAPDPVSVSDPDDAWVVVTARARRAEVLVTGDAALLVAAPVAPLPIVSPRGSGSDCAARFLRGRAMEPRGRHGSRCHRGTDRRRPTDDASVGRWSSGGRHRAPRRPRRSGLDGYPCVAVSSAGSPCAGVTSVWWKSLPLKSSGSPSSRASA